MMLALALILVVLAGYALSLYLTSTESMPTQYRHMMRRIVIWQGDIAVSGSGNVLDLGARTVRVTPGVVQSEERVGLASGNSLPIRRTHRVEIPLTTQEEAELARIMARFERCDVQAYFIGDASQGAESWAWYEPTSMNVSEPAADAGSMGATVLTMETRVFNPAIGRGDLTSYLAWDGSTVDSPPGALEYASRTGYEGPAWSVDNGAPDANGELVQDTAETNLVCPLGGATVRLAAEDGDVTGTITAFDWDGNQLDTVTDTNPELTLPEKTWFVFLQVTATPSRPRLEVSEAGRALGFRRGEVIADCDTRATAPPWTVEAVDWCLGAGDQDLDFTDSDTIGFTGDVRIYTESATDYKRFFVGQTLEFVDSVCQSQGTVTDTATVLSYSYDGVNDVTLVKVDGQTQIQDSLRAETNRLD